MLPRVTFSTLACPNWTIDTVIQNARTTGYDGIEWRGGENGHINPNATRAERASLREKMRDANLFSLAVTSYTSFVSDDTAVRAANVDDLKKYLDLAAEMDAKFVRAFLGELEPQQNISEMYPRIIESLQQGVEHARHVGVGIAIEHHDDFVQTHALVPILQNISDSSVGAVWDIANAFSANESADDGANNLRGRISYVQVKDGIGRGENWRLANVGEGNVDLKRAIELLHAQNYDDAFSVEWEYAWHPELEPPERALPQALNHVRALLNEIYK
jgi:sugar phosphate isomerase/epimerase